MDAGGTTPGKEEIEIRREQKPRAKQDARAENRSVWEIHEDWLNTSMYLALRASMKLSKICSCNFVSTDDCMGAGGRTTPGAVVEATQQSWEKCIFSGALNLFFLNLFTFSKY